MKTFEQLSKSQQVERWENVLRVLKSLTPHQRRKHFDMDGFLQETSCGTVGCAAGFCTIDPWFQRRGLKAELGHCGYYYLPGSLTLHAFFGETGSMGIFHNTTHRPVGVVMREIRAHIKLLSAQS